jgi:hypothetical protein
MENENDYELVREPKPKGYVRLVRRKAPSPPTNRPMEKKKKKKKPVPFACVLIWLLALTLAIGVLLYYVVCWYVFQMIRDAYAREPEYQSINEI